jgi:D-aspartate ligase
LQLSPTGLYHPSTAADGVSYTMSANPPAVILSGGSRAIAVSIARSLGSAGIDVHAVGEAPWDIVGHSRYCRSFVDLGTGDGVQERWLAWLESGPRGAVLLPCHDDGLEFVARNRPALIALGYVPMEANDDVLLAMLDKERTYALARRVGVPTPRTARVQSPDAVDSAIEEIGYPCAIKPVHSHLFAQKFGRKKAFIVRSGSELARVLDGIASLSLDVVITEIIPGPDDQLYAFLAYMDENGEAVVRCCKRKLRQYPPGFGMGCYHISEWNSELAELGERFFRDIGLRGLAYVEFKRDPRDGRFKLIECNHRFGTGIELFRCAGLDLPLMTYHRLLGRPVPDGCSCREGVRLGHPIDDVRAFVVYRRAHALSFRRWARSLMHPLHVPVFRWDDPRPSLAELDVLLRRARRELAQRRETGARRRAFLDEDSVMVSETVAPPSSTR